MLGYSECSKGYRVYNTETSIVEESINIIFDDKLGPQKSKQKDSLVDIEVQFIGSEDSPDKDISFEEATKDRTYEEPIQKKPSRSSLAHLEEMIMGKKDDPIRTRSTFRNSEESLMGLVSLTEQTTVDEALHDNNWIIAMQEELN